MSGTQFLTADDVIARLDLQPHPEGGHFRETFRDTVSTSGRAASTAIFYLLKANERSHGHTVDAVEIWHHYSGDALALDIATPDGHMKTRRVGSDLLGGEEPQVVVPTGHWQRARSLGAWTLVGCTVAPGFQFEGFKIAPPGFDPAVDLRKPNG